jgi:Fe-only nitrogenase accessory protein AnfO
MDIAVLVNLDGKTSLFTENGIIQVFSKDPSGWHLVREKEFIVENLNDGNELRNCLGDVGDWLNDCKLLIVKRIRGIHYLALERFQISMMEIDGYPQDFLKHLEDCSNQRKPEAKVPTEPVAIHERQPGYYYIDLQDVMSGKTSYSSKQVLLPFLKEQPFIQLEIICEHVPKWFDKELPDLNLHYDAQAFERVIKVQISPVPI